MRKADLEHKVLAIADRVQKKQPVEGVEIELKSKWPEKFNMTARQLAGHCNAARGDPVLWIIGLDEGHGAVVGASAEELANWWPRVRKEFEGEHPHLAISLPVQHGDKTLFALYFETDRAPFVTRASDSGSSVLEVPWREGNSTRSARREDLIRLLVPVMSTPSIELLSASARYYQDSKSPYWSMIFNVKLYATVRSTAILPAHRCDLEVDPKYLDRDVWSRETTISSPSRASLDDVLFEHSGSFSLKFRGISQAIGPYLPSPLSFRLTLGFLNAVGPVEVEGKLFQLAISAQQTAVEYQLQR